MAGAVYGAHGQGHRDLGHGAAEVHGDEHAGGAVDPASRARQADDLGALLGAHQLVACGRLADEPQLDSPALGDDLLQDDRDFGRPHAGDGDVLGRADLHREAIAAGLEVAAGDEGFDAAVDLGDILLEAADSHLDVGQRALEGEAGREADGGDCGLDRHLDDRVLLVEQHPEPEEDGEQDRGGLEGEVSM